MTRRSWLAATVALALGLTSRAASALLIDTFESGQDAYSALSPSCCVVLPGLSTQPAPAGSIGVTRTLTARGVARIAQVDVAVGGGTFGLSILAAPDDGRGSVSWDLAAPIDLTEGGTMRAFAFDVVSQTVAGTLRISVSSGSVFSELAMAAPGLGHYEVPFSVFDSGVLGAVTNIGIALEATPSVPGKIAIGGPFQTVPEPAVALFASAFVLLVLCAALRVTRS